ncbi:MAG: bacteriohemerythrin [Pseudodesulfovibrio sp.]|uniref:Hemerythrin-like metal-binding protein n=1 Tax=Pseudodesulfovibrio aespoeensis (strain ATCC 700646 / DSM 10631 / Aspo-2) TaxID=643562 RepID=E6VWW7_PSEA9|nr:MULTISPECIES: bacteriohemerythrin [Pseudodesulfovibrio]MBU4191181.1 bacteriohemerythrin [Pseudomonadota bacterium]ADU63729.1 hemerythrin-like metal-binding protein [Pseudodesulfovibrio aespoeensis Aspo-2]MBU4243520.1 bacteriohemerythrin [Pseudomonadota bacterium]MBU4378466.1 bacteriohemerythrin [Pseudomonadota bacterium]MBU4476817.1 bacteriohemerythrin [Pseudomonadota bacterium]
MTKINWNDELSVNVPAIDNQHKELIRIANVLINAVSLGRDDRVVGDVIRKLRDYTVFHFSSEETLMQDIRYPKRAEHEAEHRRLKQSVKNYQRVLYKKESITPHEVLDFLKEWLLTHILTFDRELARFIHAQEAAKALAEEQAQAIKGMTPPNGPAPDSPSSESSPPVDAIPSRGDSSET